MYRDVPSWESYIGDGIVEYRVFVAWHGEAVMSSEGGDGGALSGALTLLDHELALDVSTNVLKQYISITMIVDEDECCCPGQKR